jgi:ketosteroid isomerase-like protein
MQGNIILSSKEVVNGLDYIHELEDISYYVEFKKDANDKKIFCAKCKNNVRSVVHPKTLYKYIKHSNRRDDKCDNFEYTEDYKDMKRAIYRGEQSEHRKLKECIFGYIQKDTQRFTHSVSEEFCFSETEKYDNGQRKRRKPDIMATHRKIGDIAIEVQIAYVFDNDFFGKEEFYERENIPLLWFLVNLKKNKLREHQKTIFYNGNENVFFMDYSSKELTEKNGKLFFHCYYNELSIQDGKIHEDMHEGKNLTFDDLFYDKQTKEIYYKNTRKRREELLEQLKEKF